MDEYSILKVLYIEDIILFDLPLSLSVEFIAMTILLRLPIDRLRAIKLSISDM